ncbi:MAG: ABC transporter permease [Nocardioides sp.]|jgi:branched-chain amino acid transport system permease protein
MELFFANTIFGLYIGSAYAIAASGLVLTYTTTRVFNLAHGAVSMFMAFLYWQLQVDLGLPTWLSVVLVVFVIAPLFGLLLDQVMRGLSDTPVSVSLVVTVALFLALVGLAIQFWPADEYRYVQYFFGYDTVTIFGTPVGYHYLITIAVSLVVAAALYLLLNRTLTGTAMRAAVDNPELLELFGANPARVTALSWALGSMLAALGGVLLAAYTGLDYYSLTFLVVAAFAAAVLGRLTSLPLTYLGALLLGVGGSYLQAYLHVSTYVQIGLQTSLPTLMLFAIVIFVPQVQLRVGQVKGILAARIPSLRRSLNSAAGLMVAALLALSVFDKGHVNDLGLAVAFAIVMLSMVLLTGYGGYLSLAQFTFVGIGAATVAKMDTTSPVAILVAVLLATVAGALVALPVLRLTGLYLALATLAFGQLMDKLVFNAPFVFGASGSLPVKRVSILGYDFHDDAAYVEFMLVVFLVLGIGLLALRRGPIGRLLIALRDSPAACGTLGLDQRWFRVALFSAPAGIAGLAGALMAGLQELAAPGSFATIASLPTILVAVVAGVTTVSGSFLGGILLMLTLTADSQTQGLIFVVLAVGAILLARDPNGLVNIAFKAGRRAATRLPLPSWLKPGTSLESGPLPAGEPLVHGKPQVAGHGVA